VEVKLIYENAVDKFFSY